MQEARYPRVQPAIGSMKKMNETRKHKDYGSAEEARNALRVFLSWRHSKYTINDVFLSSARGYLGTTKECFCTYPPFDGSYIGIDRGAQQGHFHTISLNGVYSKDKRYPYQLWDALKKFSVLGAKPQK